MMLAPYLIILASLAFLVYYFLKDKNHWREIVLAAIITALWVALSGIYTYQQTNLSILGFNLFPFFAWTAGLVLLKAAHDKFGAFRYIKAVVSYLLILLAVEYIGYHLLGIRLDSAYPGLFGMDIMHAPWYSQVYYLLIGPIYLLILILWEKKRKQNTPAAGHSEKLNFLGEKPVFHLNLQLREEAAFEATAIPSYATLALRIRMVFQLKNFFFPAICFSCS
jgi:hypothetical protein